MLNDPNMAGKPGEHIKENILPQEQGTEKKEADDMGSRGDQSLSDRVEVILENQGSQHLPSSGTACQINSERE